MSAEIISGSEWLPLKVQKGLSASKKKNAFNKELREFNDKVFYTQLQIPVQENYILYRFEHYFVHVHESIKTRFEEKFSPFLEGDEIKYDNLINICIMVKDAGEDFRRILECNKPYMDRYTILDTGSTDNTVAIIKEVLADKRGELYEEPFINFRDSRNRLLDLAGEHCYFNIMLDDSYILHGKLREFLDFARGDDEVTSYSLILDNKDTMYTSNRVTKSSKGLRYINLMHEIIDTNNNLNVCIPYEWGYIKDEDSIYMIERTKARKQNDLNILLSMHEENPEDARTYYYIADSYIGMKDWVNALKWFEKRVEIKSGYEAEIQDSLYYIAVIKDMYLKRPWEECFDCYMKCYESNPLRAESLYFLGCHYNRKGMKHTAFFFWKNAYYLGMPSITMSVRKNIYNFHIPKDLALLCYEIGDYKLGEEAARKALEWQDDEITRKWLNIFYHINRCTFNNKKQRIGYKKMICFVSPGGWNEWDGETLPKQGLGGSETFSIRYAEHLVKRGYTLMVFCNCAMQKEYEGVTYIPIEFFSSFAGTYIIDICIINRYPEFIPVSCFNEIKTYYVMHDIASINDVIISHKNLVNILCISEWHKEQFLSLYPMFENCTEVISYGIETDVYPMIKRKEYNFIYPNFPNRGLLQLLRMWPRIVHKYPEARLDVFCDIQHNWCKQYWFNDMVEIERMLNEHKNTVTNHGWVKGEILRSFWAKAHVWFYPCTFEETCCLTAWEAAASKTLVVSNNLAALKTSIGNRGVIVEGDAKQSWWHDKALEKMFAVLDNKEEEDYIDRNYEWVKNKNFQTVVNDFVVKYIE